MPVPRFNLQAAGAGWQEGVHPQAAVLLLICLDTARPYTILTRRSPDLLHHAGQISLPGGKRAGIDENPEMTALREAVEETGLDAGKIRLLGRLPQVSVSSGFEITPVVASTTTSHTLVAQPGEVDEIITCPLDLVLHGDYRRESHEKDGFRREFLVLDFESHRIWGATARILHSLAESATDEEGFRAARGP
jgi:8-oxo-dGTP pyrophosphatase MutT (NUDIX family)